MIQYCTYIWGRYSSSIKRITCSTGIDQKFIIFIIIIFAVVVVVILKPDSLLGLSLKLILQLCWVYKYIYINVYRFMFVCVYFSHCWIYKAFLQWRCPLFGTLTTPIPTPTPTTSTTPMPSFSYSSTAWRVEAILSSFTTETLIWAAGILQFTFSMSQRVWVCVCDGSGGGSVLVSGAGAGARVSVCVWVSSCLEWARLDKCFGCHLLQALGQRRFLDRRRGTRHWNHWHGTNLGFDYL